MLYGAEWLPPRTLTFSRVQCVEGIVPTARPYHSCWRSGMESMEKLNAEMAHVSFKTYQSQNLARPDDLWTSFEVGHGQNMARSDKSWTIRSGSASSNEFAHFTTPSSSSKNLSGQRPKEIVMESSMPSTSTVSATSCKLGHFSRKARAAQTRSSKQVWFFGAFVLRGHESAACASHKYINTTGQRNSFRTVCSLASASFARNGGQDDVDATTKALGMLSTSSNGTAWALAPSMRCMIPVNFFPAKSARGRNNRSFARKKKISARCSRLRLDAA
mmetsp:Transcript_5632/g.6587  ORF Transcript_5632/g.6587 Transcript_5632/m.6587 type:complete len:274 (-) Transcript_5632:68-889(-)